MSTLHHDTEHPLRPARRDDLDHDLVAVVAMVAILGLTALCFLALGTLPR